MLGRQSARAHSDGSQHERSVAPSQLPGSWTMLELFSWTLPDTRQERCRSLPPDTRQGDVLELRSERTGPEKIRVEHAGHRDLSNTLSAERSWSRYFRPGQARNPNTRG